MQFQGTPLFMACETQIGGWAFPTDSRLDDETTKNYFKKQASKKKKKGVQAITTTSTLPFIPTPLHDLEPLFWMLIWIMCSRSLDGPVLHPWQDKVRLQVFSNGQKPTFLRNPKEFIDAFVEKFPQFSELKGPIVDMAKFLVTAHENFQSKVPGKLWPAAYADHAIPQAMVGLFDTLSSELDSIESSVKFCQPPPSNAAAQQIISHNAKRQRLSEKQ
jgi:hypothetical protein